MTKPEPIPWGLNSFKVTDHRLIAAERLQNLTELTALTMSRTMSTPALLLTTALVILIGFCFTSVEGTRGHHNNHGNHNNHYHNNNNGQHGHGNHHHHHHHVQTTTAEPSSGECDDDDYRCNGTSGQCIPSAWRCDNDIDCPLEDDEHNCTNVCSSYDFACLSGTCIPNSWRCDGDRDCTDGSDEAACHPGLQVNGHLGNGSPNSRVARHALLKKKNKTK
ncbi:hypothetical protein RRG08_039766 [Elysia crispata]|uniref:Vitellogenin receptor n=1 Tax=Elysia crispata TaxID=231223 RepID=A0AAE1DLQ1_9GAST|nr:hypothetical protein RRG08_039766 [Elysia crispata]